MNHLATASRVFVAAVITNQWLPAALVTSFFTVFAWVLRGVTSSGAVAGAVVCFILYLSGGPGAFAALVAVFLIAVIATKIGYSRKRELGTAENKAGRRASQVLANLGVATAATALAAIVHQEILLISAAAALAEAACDTASSEIGQALSGKARLLTTFEQVPAGTDGGVTVGGSLAGALASFLIAGCCVLVKFIPAASSLLIVGCCGFFGMLLDSFLGAVLERRHLLNNDAVNFCGTFFEALVAFLIALMYR